MTLEMIINVNNLKYDSQYPEFMQTLVILKAIINVNNLF